jgi:hypothetical protein
MTDYLDSLETTLIAASRRLSSTSSDATQRRWSPRRFAVAAVALVAVAAPALAAMRPWQPLLGDARLGPPPTITNDPPPRDQLDTLQVLRRPQSDADRSSATEAELRYFGSTTQGVRTGYIRELQALPGGRAVVLVPADSHTPLPASAPATLRQRFNVQDPLCVFYPSSNGDGGAKDCFTLAQIRSGEATGQLGRDQYGVVPDGVSEVRATYPDGSVVTVAAASNFYDFQAPSSSKAPEDVPSSPSQITWLGSDGQTLATIDRP